MLEIIGVLVWLFTPAGIANMSPVFAKNIPLLKKYKQPVDFGKTYRGKRLLGDNKTVRGFSAGTLLATGCGILQVILASNWAFFAEITDVIDYQSWVAVLFAAVVGFGALVGDSIASFAKRQLDIAAGESWFPFDQIDFIAGALVFSLAFFTLPFEYYIVAFGLALVLHLVVKFIGWIVGLEDKPF